MISRLMVILAGATAALALLPDVAGAAPRTPTRTKLECRIFFGPGAEGKVRYEADARRRQLMATMKAEGPEDNEGNDDDDGGDGGDIPLFSAGDRLSVTVGTAVPAYKAGEIVLASGEDGRLEGAVKLDAKARGRTVRPFPADFPALAAGIQVNIGAGSCVLQDRSRSGPGRG
jgi:hypothetical protein